MKTEALDCLRQSARWRMLGLLFECPGAEWKNQIRELIAEIDDRQLASAATHALEVAGPELYHTTFGPGGPAAPREVTYRDSTLPGQIMGELNGYYSAFAYPAPQTEPPDHISVEAGFVGYLFLKKAYALEREELEQATVTSQAIAQFVADHLSPLATALAVSLSNSELRYLEETSRSLTAAVKQIRATMKPSGRAVAEKP